MQRALGGVSGSFAEVLGFAEFVSAIDRFPGLLLEHFEPFCVAQGMPVLLYTSHIMPVRVADLGFYTSEERARTIALTCQLRGWSKEAYLSEFAYVLGKTVAALHDRGGVNDSLEQSNVTLAGEVTDFEWMFVPGINTPDGMSDQHLDERQAKEILYGIEIISLLCAYLSQAPEKSQQDFLTSYTSYRQSFLSKAADSCVRLLIRRAV
ncbi:hypothetical protein [Terriglobus sp.]|uniref:hypothetical protein n=1 Tax=Terriglobus sp. TaxID=1889013 RepID=UPI003B00CC4C